jgi:hypothetical protein
MRPVAAGACAAGAVSDGEESFWFNNRASFHSALGRMGRLRGGAARLGGLHRAVRVISHPRADLPLALILTLVEEGTDGGPASPTPHPNAIVESPFLKLAPIRPPPGPGPIQLPLGIPTFRPKTTLRRQMSPRADAHAVDILMSDVVVGGGRAAARGGRGQDAAAADDAGLKVAVFAGRLPR